MNKFLKKIFTLTCVLLSSLALAAPAYAASGAVQAPDNTLGLKARAAGIAIGMGLATAKAAEGISRQPEAEGKIRTSLMLGLVFIETAIIYALLVVILIIFVL